MDISIKIFNSKNVVDYIDNELEYNFDFDNIISLKNENREDIKEELDEAKDNLSSILYSIENQKTNCLIAVSFTYKELDKNDFYKYLIPTLNKYIGDDYKIIYEVENKLNVQSVKNIQTTFYVDKFKIKEKISNVFIEELIKKTDKEDVKDFISFKEEYFNNDNEYLPYYTFMLEVFSEMDEEINDYFSLKKVFEKNMEQFNVFLFNAVLENLSIDVVKRDISNHIKKDGTKRLMKRREIIVPSKKEEVSNSNFIELDKSKVEFKPEEPQPETKETPVVEEVSEEDMENFKKIIQQNKEESIKKIDVRPIISKPKIEEVKVSTPVVEEVKEVVKTINEENSSDDPFYKDLSQIKIKNQIEEKTRFNQNIKTINDNELDLIVTKRIRESGLDDEFIDEFIELSQKFRIKVNKKFKEEFIKQKLEEYIKDILLKIENKEIVTVKQMDEENSSSQKETATVEEVKEQPKVEVKELTEQQIYIKVSNRVINKLNSIKSDLISKYGKDSYTELAKKDNRDKLNKLLWNYFIPYKKNTLQEEIYVKYENKVILKVESMLNEFKKDLDSKKEIEELKANVSNIKEDSSQIRVLENEIKNLKRQLEMKDEQFEILNSTVKRTTDNFNTMLSNNEKLYEQIIEQKDVTINNQLSLIDKQYDELVMREERSLKYIEQMRNQYDRTIQSKDEMIEEIKSNSYSKEEIVENYVHISKVEEKISSKMKVVEKDFKDLEDRSIYFHVYYLLCNDTSFEDFPEDYYYNKISAEAIIEYHKKISNVDSRILKKIGFEG